MRRHHLQYEAEKQEDSAAPPARFSEKVSGLPNTDEGVRRRAGATEIGGESSALAGLQKHGRHQDETIENQENEKKRVKH